MDIVDLEDGDDLNDLEARLYAQIHHESCDDKKPSDFIEEPSSVRTVTKTSVINKATNNRSQSSRYWNNNLKNESPVELQPTTNPKSRTINAETATQTSSKPKPNQAVDKEKIIPSDAEDHCKTTDKDKEHNKEEDTDDVLTNKQLPDPQVKEEPTEIQQLISDVPLNEVKITISEDILENPSEIIKEALHSTQHGESEHQCDSSAEGNQTIPQGVVYQQRRGKNNKNQKDILKQGKQPPKLFERQMTKLNKAIKYDAKKKKAQVSRSKANKIPISDCIDLLSESDNDGNDVVEVPLPESMTIDISSDENEKGNAPQDKNESDKKEVISSRCTTPCSVVSDDFIGQHDRSRLLEESNPDDEDLLTLQEDIDRLFENSGKDNDENTISNTKAVNKELLKTPSDYRVTQSAFQAVDVYESESDIQESVYWKGSKKPSITVNLDRDSSSDDDVQEVITVQKTKRLKKRRASSTNKTTDVCIDSSDSDFDGVSTIKKSRGGAEITPVPYIAHGEAIPDCITKYTTEKVVNSDSEFLETLTNLAKSDQPTEKVELTESESDTEITAREIAEKVIEKEMNTGKEMKSDTNRSSVVQSKSSELSEALPQDLFLNLEKEFEKIDNLNNAQPKDEDPFNDSDDSVVLVPSLYKDEIDLTRCDDGGPKDPVYNVVYCGGKTHFLGIGWNEEMRRFYNQTWNGRNFNVRDIRSKMSKARALWKIYTFDRFPVWNKAGTIRCLNCFERGHVKYKCPRPRKPPVCYMCGQAGHYEPRCPNTICLKCGAKTRMFTKSCSECNYQNKSICPICSLRGHTINICPDKWRRYHSTTKANDVPNHNVEYKGRSQKFCCICGLRGHWAERCKSGPRFLEYPLFESEIRSHQKSYDDIPVKTLRSGLGYNLLYEPHDNMAFKLTLDAATNQFYSRFLSAVGLSNILKRKHPINAGGQTINKKQKTGVIKKQTKNTSSEISSAQKISANTSSKKELTSDETPAPPVEENKENTVESDNSVVIIDEEGTDEAPNATTFKVPDTSLKNKVKTDDTIDIIDSDSNYSFSEHFGIQSDDKHTEIKEDNAESPLEYIPLANEEDIELVDESKGEFVSAEPDEEVIYGNKGEFISAESDEDNKQEDDSKLEDTVCDAKIVLNNSQTDFVLSNKGSSYIHEIAKRYQIKTSVEQTSFGRILKMIGTHENQDKFHEVLQQKFREVFEQTNRKQQDLTQKVPRKRQVLIRYLREQLGLLLSTHCNVNSLYNNLKNLDSSHSKNASKAAEKIRRTINIILIGQAGLQGGAQYLENLCTNLQDLILNCNDEFAPNHIRDEIDTNWRYIFTSYRHENYEELIRQYNKLENKNQFQRMNSNFSLLEDNDRSGAGFSKSSTNIAKFDQSKIVPNPFSGKHHDRTPDFEKKRNRNIGNNQRNKDQKKNTDNLQLNPKSKTPDMKWETHCMNTLEEIDTSHDAKANVAHTSSKAPSPFWSREASRYIKECMKFGKSNDNVINRLSRVQMKSQQGLLSYNDYRTIINIHTSMKTYEK